MQTPFSLRYRGLNELPDELLSNIFEAIPRREEPKGNIWDVEGFEKQDPAVSDTLHALSSTCRRFHNIVEPLLYETFCDFLYGSRRKFIWTIIKRPHLGARVKNVLLFGESHRQTRYGRSKARDVDLARGTDPVDRFMGRARWTSGLENYLPSHIRGYLLRNINRGVIAAEIVLFLLFTPNIRKFMLYPLEEDVTIEWLEMVSVVNTLCKPLSGSLGVNSSLESLALRLGPAQFIAKRYPSGATAATPFPSLRKLVFDSDRTELSVPCPLDVFSVKELKFSCCRDNTETMAFLQRFGELESIELNFALFSPYDGDTDFKDVLDFIGPHRPFLKHLKVTASSWSFEYHSQFPPMPSLHCLPKLKTLELPDYAVELHENQYKPFPQKFQNFPNFLPATLEELTVSTKGKTATNEMLLALALWASLLPTLRKIIMYLRDTKSYCTSEIRQALEEADLEYIEVCDYSEGFRQELESVQPGPPPIPWHTRWTPRRLYEQNYPLLHDDFSQRLPALRGAIASLAKVTYPS